MGEQPKTTELAKIGNVRANNSQKNFLTRSALSGILSGYCSIVQACIEQAQYARKTRRVALNSSNKKYAK